MQGNIIGELTNTKIRKEKKRYKNVSIPEIHHHEKLRITEDGRWLLIRIQKTAKYVP